MPFVLGVLDDITLGPYSIMDADHLHPHIAGAHTHDVLKLLGPPGEGGAQSRVYSNTMKAGKGGELAGLIQPGYLQRPGLGTLLARRAGPQQHPLTKLSFCQRQLATCFVAAWTWRTAMIDCGSPACGVPCRLQKRTSLLVIILCVLQAAPLHVFLAPISTDCPVLPCVLVSHACREVLHPW